VRRIAERGGKVVVVSWALVGAESEVRPRGLCQRPPTIASS
jgi:hypothetical protein